MADLADLAQRIGHRFADPTLLEQAMAHRSWCAEHPGHLSNERLEFLGDAVLGWIVADAAYHRFPELPEGALTDLRKRVVNAGALAAVAREIGLGDHVLLGNGEAAAGGASKQSILSDALEAVLGAVYLDGGSDAARAVIERLVVVRFETDPLRSDTYDFKTQLQELASAAGLGAPSYVVHGSGPDHARSFDARVLIDGVVHGEGVGRSKKRAEQAAARAACIAWDQADARA
jgi:ribonuclease-3